MFALAVSLPLYPLLMSISLLTLTGNWILEGNFKQKFNLFLSNKIALILSSLFLLHIIGLAYTSDFDYAFKDIRIKSPLLALPLIVATAIPFSRKMLLWILHAFILSVFVTSIICFAVYLSGKYVDIRDNSIFISHIRFSLMICLAFFYCLYWLFLKKEDLLIRFRFTYLIIAIWFLVFLFVLESFTGISIMLLVSVFYLVRYLLFVKKRLIKVLVIIIIVAIPLVVFENCRSVYHEIYCDNPSEKVDFSQTTLLGNKYTHDTLDRQTENCKYVMRYISEFEMSEAWNKRSNLNYHFKDNKGQYIRFTIMRFLTSKGYHKDAEGVNKLTAEEVKSIENGIANCNLAQLKGVKARIYELMWEFKNFYETGNPNAHSMMLRILFWDASLEIIKENFLFGVGTGDMNIAFESQYSKTNSPLDKEWRLRSHNQYLSITVGFGVIGFIWFMIVLFYPFFKNKKWNDYYYLSFFIIILLSMITEDTIESQPGLIFYAYFSSLLLLGVQKININCNKIN